jgi:hypothetical protein
MRALNTTAVLALALLSCDSSPRARAFRVEDRVQLVGGPSAIGELGDYVIENERLRAVVLQGGNSVGPGMFGGTIVDVDLRRPETGHAAGRGADQFGEVFPMVNLMVPGYQDEESAGIGDLDVSILSDGGDGRCPLPEAEAPEGCAAIRVAGRSDALIEALGMVELLTVYMDVAFITYYILRPGDPYVLMRTFFWVSDEWDPSLDDVEIGSEEEAARLLELALAPSSGTSYQTLQEPEPIFTSLLGDILAPNPGELSPYRDKGLLAGDFLLFGKGVEPFGTSTLDSDDPGADRSGFDISYLFQRRYDRGEVVLSQPIADTVIVGVGDRVSYGYMSGEGSVVVPILTGSFTGVFTHRYQCVTETNAEDCGDELARPLVYDRYLVVGTGDAASVLEVYYELNDLPTGRVLGHVFDEVTGAPLEGAEVFALRDPRALGVADADVSTYEAASDALRGIDFDGDAEARPDDNPSIVSFAATDSGFDHVADASWSMSLEPGDYLLVPFVHDRRPGRPVPVTIAAGQEVEVSLALPPAARLSYEVYGEGGEPVTAKLTVIGPLGDDAGCPIDSTDPDLVPALSELRRLELGSSERPTGIATVVYSQTGRGEIALAPGRYDVIASRGFEFSIDRRCVELRHETTPVETFSIVREVDTTGWVAGDFHVHGVNSYDGNVTHERRVVTAVAEGLEVFSTTDHDYLTNLEPVISDLDMRDALMSMVGVEVTPMELGHLLGYPLRFDETAPDNNAPDWTRRDHCLENPADFGCPDNDSGYLGLTPEEIFQALRELGEFGPEHTVVAAPHPRDGFFGLFDQYGLNQFDLTLDAPGMMRGQNPLLADFPPNAAANERYRLYSENFDAIELFNGARYEFVRTPTVAEVTSFVTALSRASAESLSDEEYARAIERAHDASLRRVVVRTREEQALLRYGREGFIECLEHADCGDGELCHPDRRRCVPDSGYCSDTMPCADGLECVPSVRDGQARCLEPCHGDADCHVDAYCLIPEGEESGTCTPSACNIGRDGAPLPEAEAVEAGDRPCVRNGSPHVEGVIDDWFRLLDYGVVYTGMGNSDTHTLSSEIGLPRNFVASSVDAPAMIDRRELADNIRASRVVVSYGPFVEVTAEGGVIGDTVQAEGPVELHVRVQSASWFDVDRIEVYANGELLCDLGYLASAPCPTEATLATGADGHDTDLVNFDGVITDDPEIDTWYVVIAMGVGDRTRGLSPVYFAAMHPNLGFSEIIGQAFAAFDNPILAAVVPPPVARAELNRMIPYAVTNPIWIESTHDDDDVWTPPMGIGDPDDLEARGLPPYRRSILCQHSIEARGCRDQELMPLSTESLGVGGADGPSNPFLQPAEDDAAAARRRRISMVWRALARLVGSRR